MLGKEVYNDKKGEGLPDIFFDYVYNDCSHNFHINNSKVLDIGGGIGIATGYLKNKSGNHLILSDVSEKCLNEAKSCDRANEYLLLDASKDIIPLLENSIDCVLLFDCLEHMSDPYFALSEAKKVCKERGLFYISIPDEKQHEGYRGHNHAFVYPGLFYEENFRRFLKQMYLKILFHKVIKNTKTSHRIYESDNSESYTNVEPLHHLFICENFKTDRDILKLITEDFNEKDLNYPKHEA